MPIRAINLLPATRREARRRRARLRRWIAGAGIYSALLAAALSVQYAVWSDDGAASETTTATIERKISDSQSTLGSLRPELVEARQKLDAMQTVADQPDWSILLAVVSQTSGPEIALTDCRVQPRLVAALTPDVVPVSSTAGPAKPQFDGCVLELSGFGRTQYDVSSFVLRLEQTKLFDRVTLLKSSRETLGSGEGVAFRVQAIMTGGQKP